MDTRKKNLIVMFQVGIFVDARQDRFIARIWSVTLSDISTTLGQWQGSNEPILLIEPKKN